MKLREHLDLLRGLLTGEIAFTSPFFVSIDLTRRCNLNCRYCRFHSAESDFPSPVAAPIQDFPFDLLQPLLAELGAGQTKDIIFAGEGEPLLYPRFLEAVTTAKAAGLHVNVITNGTLLDEPLIRKLIAARLDRLTVSLWASSPAEYERLCPGSPPENFAKLHAALKLVTKVKTEMGSQLPRLRLHRPIGRDNFQTLETAFDQALAGGCNELTIAPVHSLKGDLSTHLLDHLPADQKQALHASLARLKTRLRQHHITHNIDVATQLIRLGQSVWETLPCYVGWVHSRLRIDGTVFPCGRCDLPLGRIDQQSFHSIWNDQPYRRFRRTASTRDGLQSLQQHCLCGFCCHLRNSIRIHRLFRWLAPLAALLRRRQPNQTQANSIPPLPPADAGPPP